MVLNRLKWLLTLKNGDFLIRALLIRVNLKSSGIHVIESKGDTP